VSRSLIPLFLSYTTVRWTPVRGTMPCIDFLDPGWCLKTHMHHHQTRHQRAGHQRPLRHQRARHLQPLRHQRAGHQRPLRHQRAGHQRTGHLPPLRHLEVQQLEGHIVSTFCVLWQFVSNSNCQAWNHQPAQSTDRDKFAPLQSPFAPFPIPAWTAALAAVDQSVCVDFPTTIYAFPDPGLLVGPAKDERKARFIETWVRSRDAWISRVAQEGSLAMKAQHWREFLLTDLSNVSELTGASTKSEKRRQHVQVILKEKLSFDLSVAPRCTVGEPFVWQGRDYPPGELPPENVVRQILWELYELNFSQEFLALDRRACTNLEMRDTETLYARQTSISKCFTSNSINYIRLPHTNGGLAAENIRDRLPYLYSMVHVMATWKGTKPAAFDLAKRSPELITNQQAESLEDAATKYYCQQFFIYFGRAAQIPHRLFPVQK
jgi:hypothetical protein